VEKNLVLTKSYQFALRMLRLHQYLCSEKQEYILSRQALIAGTEIGAHVKAAQEAEARTLFFQEMGIARRQASKTEYWLQLLHEGGFLDEKAFVSIHADCVELLKLLTAILKSENRP
jgi:four helix bundle protein